MTEVKFSISQTSSANWNILYDEEKYCQICAFCLCLKKCIFALWLIPLVMLSKNPYKTLFENVIIEGNVFTFHEEFFLAQLLSNRIILLVFYGCNFATKTTWLILTHNFSQFCRSLNKIFMSKFLEHYKTHRNTQKIFTVKTLECILYTQNITKTFQLLLSKYFSAFWFSLTKNKSETRVLREISVIRRVAIRKRQQVSLTGIGGIIRYRGYRDKSSI